MNKVIHNSHVKRFTVIVLALAMLAIGCVVAYAEYYYLVDRDGYLEAGISTGGSVYIPYNSNIGIIVGAGNTSSPGQGYLEFSFGRLKYSIPCDGNAHSIFSPTEGPNPFEGGMYSYTLKNTSNTDTMAYTLAIIQDR